MIQPANLPSTREHPKIVQEKLTNEIKLGRIAGPFSAKPFSHLVVSPIGLVPKKTPGKFRLIHHLSYPRGNSINSGIDRQHTTVTYHTVDHAIDIITSLGRSVFFAKTDIEAAFRLVPVHPEHYYMLGFTWQGEFYYDKVLAMGLSASCQVFEKFSSAIQWIAQARLNITHMLHILDDFLIIAETQQQCRTQLRQFLSLCADIGIPLAPGKTEGPATTLTFAGIELDSVAWEARLPMEKLQRYRSLIRDIKKRKKLTLRELQSVIGCLSHCCYIIPAGRPFLRRLIDLTMGVHLAHHHIRLNKEVRADLATWASFLDQFNGRALFLNREWLLAADLHLYTDAAQSAGYGALCGNHWFFGEWPSLWKSLDITLLEFYPIVAAVQVWGARFANKRIILHTDNMALTFIINKLTSSDKTIMSLVRKFTFLTLQFNIHFYAEHIPGSSNILADLLSRLQLQAFHRLAPTMSPEPTHLPPELLPANYLLS